MRVSIETDAGEEMIAMLEEGHHLGEMSFIEKSPRSANGIANTEPTAVVAIDDRQLEKLMAENVMIRYRILRVFTDTLLSRLESTYKQFASTLVMALADTRIKGPNEVLSETTFEYPEDAASILARGGDLRDAAMVDKALASEILRVILPELSKRLREIDRRLRIAKEL